MLSKSNRLSKLQFDEVFKKGRVLHSPIFVARVIIGTSDTRFSSVFPQKISKTAAGRNSSRRRVYNCIRSITLAPVKNKCWMSLIAKKSIKDVSPEELQRDIRNVFVKSGILE